MAQESDEKEIRWYKDAAFDASSRGQADSAMLLIDIAIQGYEAAGKLDTMMNAMGDKGQLLIVNEGPQESLDYLYSIQAKGTKYFPNPHQGWIEILYQLSNAHSVKGNLDSALHYATIAETYIDETYVPPYKQGRILLMLSRIATRQRNTASSISYAENALKQYLLAYPDTSSHYYAIRGELASAYNYDSNYSDALFNAIIAREGYIKDFGEWHFNVGVMDNSIASIYDNLGRYDEALVSYRHAQEVFTRYYQQTGQKQFLNIILGNLSLLYHDFLETQTALQYAKACYQEELKYLDEVSPQFLFPLGNLITYHGQLNQGDEAAIFVNKMQHLVDENPSMSAGNKSYAFNIMLTHFSRHGDLKNARKYFKKFLTNFNNSGLSENKVLASAYHTMGDLFTSIDQADSAVYYYRTALEIYKPLYALQSHAIVKQYLAISQAVQDENAKHSLLMADSALLLLNWPVKSFDRLTLLSKTPPSPIVPLLYQQYSTLLSTHKTAKLSEKPTELLSYYEDFLSNYFPIIRSQYRLQQLGEISDQLYSAAIQENLNTGNIDEAFRLSEKSRAIAIRLALNQYESEATAGIPDSIIQREAQLRQRLQQPPTTDSLVQLTDAQQAMEDYQQFIAMSKKQFPTFYKRKYDLASPDIDVLKRNLNNSTLISFRILRDTLCAFLVNEDEINFINYKHPVHRDSILKLYTSLNTGKDDRALRSYLYNELLSPIENKLSTEEIFIIPDGALHYLNFEILQRTSGMLIEEHTISYAIAADLLFASKSNHKDKTWVGFVPGFDDSLKSAYVDSLSENQEADSFFLKLVRQPQILQWAEQFKQDKGSTFYTRQEATEKRFREQLISAPLLFIGSHAEVDDTRPYMSRIIFAKDMEESTDGYLHAYELYGLRIDADLAILSACNTGIGQLKAGEGVISMNHAFAFAGCPSTVMSKWAIDESQTVSILDNFVQELKKGKKKNEALRDAKLAYIRGASDVYQSPIYWAGLNLVGDPRPIGSTSPSVIYYLLGISCLIILVAFIRRRKIRAKR